MQTLVDSIGVPLLRRGAELAADVSVRESGFELYAARVAGHEVVYDGSMFPGAARCDCGDAFMTTYCGHVAAVALLVLGKGTVPDIALEGFPGLARGYPADRRFPVTLSADPSTFGQAQAFAAPVLAELAVPVADAKQLRARIESVCAAADRMTTIGRPDSAAQLLQLAVEPVREDVRALLADAEEPDDYDFMAKGRLEDIERAGDALIDALLHSKPRRDAALLEWVKGIIAGERPGEETLAFSQMKQLLDDSQLAELLQWLDGLDRPGIESWGRRLGIAGFLDDREAYARVIREAPDGTHSIVMAYYRGFPPTDHSIAALSRYADQGLIVVEHDSDPMLIASELVDWLSTSDTPEAVELIRRIGTEFFDAATPLALHRSASALARGFGRDETTHLRALQLAGIAVTGREPVLSAEGRLSAAIIESVFITADPGAELIGIDSAESLPVPTALQAAEIVDAAFPATAANLAMAAAFTASRLSSERPFTMDSGDVRVGVRKAAEYWQASGKPWKYWLFLLELTRRSPVDEFDRRMLAVDELWPAWSTPRSEK